MVVFTSLCPRSSWMVRISCPLSSRWVAKECRLCRARHNPGVGIMREGVAGDSFRDPGANNGFPDGFLEYRFVQVVAVKAPVGSVRKLPVSREHPLPAPLPLRPWVFPCDRSRKFNISPSVPDIFFMLRPDVFEVSLQIVQGRRRQNGDAVPVPFPSADRDLPHSRIDILHAIC